MPKENAANEIIDPINIAIRKGLKLKEVIPLNASFVIFANEYFVLPKRLSGASKFMVVEVKPIQLNMPLKKSSLSLNNKILDNTFLLKALKSEAFGSIRVSEIELIKR